MIARQLTAVLAVALLLAPLALSESGPPSDSNEVYVDEDGDTMTGALVMQAEIELDDQPILFDNGALLGSSSAPGLRFAGDRVCTSGLVDPGCGDLTSLTAGHGLTGGGSAGDVTLAVDTAVIQARVSEACPAGSAIRAISQAGAVTCEVDDDTLFDGTDFALSDQACPTGELVGAIDGAGALVCRTDGLGWALTGNAGTDPATDFLGTTDDTPLVLATDGQRVFRFGTGGAPNLLGGSYVNLVDPGVEGATISGGGTDDLLGSVSPNLVSDDFGTVGGGLDNTAGGVSSTVAGGTSNQAKGDHNTIGGGEDNLAAGSHATIGGGVANRATASWATVAGGNQNVAQGLLASVGGGQLNDAWGDGSTVGGGGENLVDARFGTIAGGGGLAAELGNQIREDHGTIGGGQDNRIVDTDPASSSSPHSTIAGGFGNHIEAQAASIGGGEGNEAKGDHNTIGGGEENLAAGSHATIGGGVANRATASWATVAGGTGNVAQGLVATASGGQQNNAWGDLSTVGGGAGNLADARFATIAGGGSLDAGHGNEIHEDHGTIGGGIANLIGDGDPDSQSARFATIGGGFDNEVSAGAGTVAGGEDNRAEGAHATVAGGKSNAARGGPAAIGGGVGNLAIGSWTTVAGGTQNVAQGEASTVAGGHLNLLLQAGGAVGGGAGHLAEARFATIAGGGGFGPDHGGNRIFEDHAAIGGGADNVVGDGDSDTGNSPFATIAGGKANSAGAGFASIGGGQDNQVDGGHGTVAGGQSNRAASHAWVGGGLFNAATGVRAMVPGGQLNVAQGDLSLAAGNQAQAMHPGTFVWADQSVDAPLTSTGANQFLVRAQQGMGVGTPAPVAQLHVREAIDASPTLANHVAVVENPSTGAGPDVLALKVGTSDPGTGSNLITFLDGDGGIGAIEGDGAGGVTLKSGSADLAEYLPKQDPGTELTPGQVVGLAEGRVSLDTGRAEQALVVSTTPIVLGNQPSAGQEDDHVPVALVGQVPVQILGPVQAGDLLVPSGLEDGTAVSRAPGEITLEEASSVIGRALTSSADESGTVTALVGLSQGEILASIIQGQQDAIESLEDRLESLEDLVAGLTSPSP